MFSKIRSLIFKIDYEKEHTLAIKTIKINLVSSILDENKNDPLYNTKINNKE